jgi:hypothetical protein
VRWATSGTLAIAIALVACNDLRDFRGDWSGARVGDAPVLRVGGGDHATLAIDDVNAHGLSGRLAIDGLAPETPFTSLEGAEADALANVSFGGSPLRVYLGFFTLPDGGGDAFVVVALYDDRRIEVRLLRGGTSPLYAIFALSPS